MAEWLMRATLARLIKLCRRRHLADELDDEIRAHYDALRQALEDEGHAPEQAARLARLRLGGATQIREASQDEWRLGTFEGAGQDLRLAARSLRRRPGFAAAAVATLALGIGASTAMFSVAYGVALRPLPFPAADRLVRIYEANPGTGTLEAHVSDGAFHEWRRSVPALESAALFSPPGARSLAGPDAPRLLTMRVSPAFFDVVGVRPLFGPGFKPESEYTRFTTTDAVLSHRTWQRLFGGRRDMIGAPLTLAGAGDDDVFHVVGVMPDGFEFLEPVDAWFPQVLEEPAAMRLLSWRYDRVVARLREGATIERARAELEAAAARLAAEYPRSNAGWTASIASLHDAIVGQFARATWLLLAATAVVLVIASLNVAGLFTARTMTRARETAVRASLGAGTWRLLRLWLAEAALLTAAGGAAGVLLAWGAVRALIAAAPPGIPRLDAIAIDGPTLLVAIVAMAVAAIVFAAAPFARGWSNGIASELRLGSAPAGERRERRAIQTAVTVAQCAGAATLVVLAVMLTRSLLRLVAFDLGWQPAGVVSVQAEPRMPSELRRPWYARVEWTDRLVAQLEATPGITRAAVTTQLPLGPAPYMTTIARGRGADTTDPARWLVIHHKITEGYFDLMKISMGRGRPFGPQDRFTQAQMTSSDVRPEAGAVIVSESTARALWPGEAAVGQALWLADNTDNVRWREVVGVVADLQFDAIGEAPAMHVFVPWTQDSASARVYVLAATRDADASGPVARSVVQTVAPGAAVDRITSLDALVSRATAQPRFTSRVVAAFGALALVLAAVGIYGTLAYLVGARTREIGVRLALGAPRHGILIDVLRRGLMPAIAGGAIGLAAALGLARAFRALLFEIAPIDPVSIAAGAAALLVVAAVAAIGPAWRAAGVDPVRALRAE